MIANYGKASRGGRGRGSWCVSINSDSLRNFMPFIIIPSRLLVPLYIMIILGKDRGGIITYSRNYFDVLDHSQVTLQLHHKSCRSENRAIFLLNCLPNKSSSKKWLHIQNWTLIFLLCLFFGALDNFEVKYWSIRESGVHKPRIRC